MNRGTVLILTDTDDQTVDLIVHELQRRDASVVRLDPGAGPIHLDARLDGDRWRGLVGDEHRAVRLDEVVSVLWRWPGLPAGHPDIGDPAARLGRPRGPAGAAGDPADAARPLDQPPRRHQPRQ
ncbi:MvdC/MvdD family ATP grasp protein [Actinomadura litoris]|uniref:Uncharacterized protein n=1 Tax=Actinomadura litoris TaxID=2678616 RepID=A0A7K1LB97_9ACTN|nr:hypothetical protein [Actinomadura litoris]MUN41692.1 hypothetical protein [Actinomadura litoris]